MDPNDPLVLAVERLIVAGGSLTSRSLALAAPHARELSVAGYRALVQVVQSDDGLRIGELARLGSTSSQAATRLVQRLEARGLVTLTRGTPEDRRAVVVRPTAASLELWAAISAARRGAIAEALAGERLDAIAAGTSTAAAALDRWVRDAAG